MTNIERYIQETTDKLFEFERTVRKVSVFEQQIQTMMKAQETHLADTAARLLAMRKDIDVTSSKQQGDQLKVDHKLLALQAQVSQLPLMLKQCEVQTLNNKLRSENI